ncbi:MAG: hypothetical protein O7G31_01195 [Calditrichaeota bacterium]|nr:hypothetical protein [Calditrichota bacterium]
MNHRLLELLYRSFDEDFSDAEHEELSRALAASADLRTEKVRITTMRQLVKEDGAGSFRPFFSARVMHRIKTQKTQVEDFFSSLVWSFRLIVLVGAVAVVLLVAHNSLQSKSLTLDSILGMPQLSLEETWEFDLLAEEETK